MMTFIVLPALTYHDTATDAVTRHHLAPPWNSSDLIRAINSLAPGDELSINTEISVIRLTGKDIDYGAHLHLS